MVGPRLHAVSDPLPLSTVDGEQSIDEWFKANFDSLFALPPPVDVTEPDFSTQWEIELFNKYTLPENPQEVPVLRESLISFGLVVIFNMLLAIPDYESSSSADLAALDDLLKSLGSDDFVTPPEIMHPPTSALTASSVSQDLPILPDLSQFIDWTALLNESSQPTCDSIISQPYVDSTLPEIDLSFLQLPQVWTAVAS